MSDGSRTALFVGACAALIAAALLLRSPDAVPAPESGHPPPRAPVPTRPSAPPPALASSARRFLATFLRYEVGDPSPELAHALRATATRAFAAELLRTPPRPTVDSRRVDPTLGPLTFAPVSNDPPLVSVSGIAHRHNGPEQFSFVFEFSHGSWLASAPGE